MGESSTSERREYFRCDGTVYMRFLSPDALQSLPDQTMDHAGVLLRNLRARLDYENPEEAQYIIALLECIEAMHARMQILHAPAPEKNDFEKKSVNISGSGIAFFSPTPMEPGTLLTLQIAFAGYPFAIVTVNAEVRHVLLDVHNDQYRVTCRYHDILETDRDLIVRFVNYLQRLERQRQLDAE